MYVWAGLAECAVRAMQNKIQISFDGGVCGG
jgi:hypothetical protein